MELTIESFAVSRIYPPTISSSKIPYTLLKLKTISSSQTLPKYWSKVSTNKWINFKNKKISYLQMKQFIVVDIDTESKVEPGIPFVNDLEVMQLILLNKRVLLKSWFAWNLSWRSFCEFTTGVWLFRFLHSAWTTCWFLFCPDDFVTRWIGSELSEGYHLDRRMDCLFKYKFEILFIYLHKMI